MQAVRIARHTERLNELVAFYRDGLGLVEIGGFRGHGGYDGRFLALPGTGAHLELTAGGDHGAREPHRESLVLYLEDRETVDETLQRVGAEPVAAANPYWNEHGVTVADPDGFRVVLVPERWAADAADVNAEIYDGPRGDLRHLFELAEDSAAELDGYLEEGRVLVARVDGAIVGELQLIETGEPTTSEIKNMAVEPVWQGRGVGCALVTAAEALARGEGCRQLLVATAAADIGNLRFYQRLGFRMHSVERDAFTPAAGYAGELRIDGIELRDRVWLSRPC